MSRSSISPFRGGAAHPLAGVTVLQIIPDLQPSAAARATIDIAAALNRIGANALVACQGGGMVSELQAMGGVFVPFPAHAKNPLGMALNMRRLAQLIKTERIDIVHARSRAPAWAAYGATRLTKTPFITSFQGVYAGGSAFYARYNSIMARGDAILADSGFAAGMIAKLYPATAAKIRIVHRSVDCKIFAPNAIAPARVQAVRREWRVAPDERVVFLPEGARASGEHKLLMETARILTAQGLTGTKFILAGEGPDGGARAKDIDRSIAKAGLQDQDFFVRRAGACADLPAALLAAAIVVAPSPRLEALPAIAIEAQAMGTPVIVADAGAASETVLAPPEIEASRRTGWRAPSGDARALAKAVIEILNLGATARDQLSLRARAHVETNFSIERACAATLDAYMAWQPSGEG